MKRRAKPVNMPAAGNGADIRLDGISWMNLISCMAVILIHCTSEFYYTGRETGMFFDALFVLRRLSSCAVYGFVFLSGMKLSLKPPKTWGGFYLGRLKRVVMPYIIWTCIYYAVYCVYGRYTFGTGELARLILSGGVSAQFYFVIVIVQFYALMPLWTAAAKKLPASALIIFSAAVTVLSQRYINNIVRYAVPDFSAGDRVFTSYLVFWVAGCVCGVHKERFFAAVKKYAVPLAGACVLLAAANCAAAYSAEIMQKSVPFGNELHLLYSFAVITAGTAALNSARMPRLLKKVNAVTYSIFLAHCLVMYLIKYYMDAAGDAFSSPCLRLGILAGGTYGITIFLCCVFGALRRKNTN